MSCFFHSLSQKIGVITEEERIEDKKQFNTTFMNSE